MNKQRYLVLTVLIVAMSPLQSCKKTASNEDLQTVSTLACSSSEIANPAACGIEVQVAWDTTVRQIPPYAYGVNSPANFIPRYSNDPFYMDSLEFLTQKKGFVRLHGWGMLGDSPEAWLQNGVWNPEKIEQALRPLVDDGYTVMINIPAGPQGEGDYQDPVAFARFCANLVQIVNVDLDLGINYWEVPNERESGFADPGLSVNEMATLIKNANREMKVVDPSIQVGGPAAAWVNVDYISQLVEETYPAIDFITVHTYSGDGSNSLDDVYDIAQRATADLAEIRTRINLITGERYLPIFLSEYNVAFQGSPRIRTHEGAVYEAIILTQSIQSGADASIYWAIAPYSDMSLIVGNMRDENAYIYEIFNTSFHGQLLQSQSGNPAKVVAYAVSDQNSGQRAFGLINRTKYSQSVNLRFDGWLPTELTWHKWDADNDFSTLAVSWPELGYGNFILSPYSVNLFIE